MAIEALIEAIIQRDTDKVKQLLKQGVDPNATLDEDRITGLHFAAQNNLIDIAILLLSAGANSYAETRPDGYTPLDIAIMHHHQEMIELLTFYRQGSKTVN